MDKEERASIKTEAQLEFLITVRNIIKQLKEEKNTKAKSHTPHVCPPQSPVCIP